MYLSSFTHLNLIKTSCSRYAKYYAHFIPVGTETQRLIVPHLVNQTEDIVKTPVMLFVLSPWAISSNA